MKAFPAFVCAALLCLPALADDKAPRRDRAWMVAQLAAWDLTREGAPPFRLTATLEVFAEDGWVTGSYSIIWAAPDRWREEVRFPGYEETEGMAGDIRWRKRPTRYRPRLPWLVTAPIRSDRFPSPEPEEFRQSRPKKGKPALACIGEVCVDAVTGEPWSRDLRDVIVRFDPPAVFSLRSWPAAHHAIEREREVGRASVQQLQPLGSVDEALFQPPSDAVQISACAMPTTPRATKKTKPPYPTSLRAQHIQGTVRLRATIAVDGTVQEIEVSHAPDPKLAALAMQTVQQWRYEPAHCGDRPVPIDMWIDVNWTLY